MTFILQEIMDAQDAFDAIENLSANTLTIPEARREEFEGALQKMWRLSLQKTDKAMKGCTVFSGMQVVYDGDTIVCSRNEGGV